MGFEKPVLWDIDDTVKLRNFKKWVSAKGFVIFEGCEFREFLHDMTSFGFGELYVY